MKIFGHPIHLMMIHFPAALLPFDLICSFLAFYTGDETFKFASFYAMAGGVIIGCVAITFGALDLLNVFKEKPDAVKIAVVHGSINTCVIMVYNYFGIFAIQELSIARV